MANNKQADDLVRQQQEQQELLDAQNAMRLLDEDEYDGSYAPAEFPETAGVNDTQERLPFDDVPVQEDEQAVSEEVEPSDEQQFLDQTEPDQPETVDELMDYAGDYTNGVARALDNIGNVFGDTTLGQMFHSVAQAVEDRFGTTQGSDLSVDEAMRDEMTKEVTSDDAYTQAEFSSLDVSDVSADDFVQDLSDAASGNPDELMEKMQTAVSDTAVSAPVETAQAIQMFNDAAAGKIQEAYAPGTSDYKGAMQNLSAVMGGMTGAYYDTLLSKELDGSLQLSEDQKKAINGLDVQGVQISYDEYLPGDDVSVNKSNYTAKQAVSDHKALISESQVQNDGVSADSLDELKRSDGSVYKDVSEDEKQSNDMMAGQGRSMVVSGGMLDAADSNDFDDMRIEFDKKASDLREATVHNQAVYGEGHETELKEQTAQNYMSMLHGVQAYNDAAVEAIEEQYADDLEKKALATQGLANTMRAAVGHSFDIVKNDNDAMDFLSEEDKAELDNMSFTGVNVKFSDYQSGMDLKTGDMPEKEDSLEKDVSMADQVNPDADYDAEEQELYGGHLDDAVEAYAPADKASEQKNVSSVSPKGSHQMSHEDRVAKASSMFSAALDNEETQMRERNESLGLGE